MSNQDKYSTLALIGCGQLFDEIVAYWSILAEGRTLLQLSLASTDAAADDTADLLAGLNPAQTRIFAAVDTQAVNHARLDVYAKARLMGFKAVSLRHPWAIVAEDVQVGENCWVGAGAVIAPGTHIGHNTIIGDMARIEARTRLGAHAWVGGGASVGLGTVLGQHCLIGRDVRLGPGLHIGRHCVIDVPGAYNESLPEGTFIDALFAEPVRIYGVNAGK